MKNLLKLEELAMFGLAVYLFGQTNFAWWYFLLFLFLPDISMLGYLAGSRTGALFYNFFHHKALGILVLLAGYWLQQEVLTVAGIILFAHASLDRILGYGLKYPDAFQHTHLGTIGKKQPAL